MITSISGALPKDFYGPLASKWLESGGNLEAMYPNADDRLAELVRQYAAFSPQQRAGLVHVLEAQYAGTAHPKVLENIRLLGSEDTFTVTTGQQIHIFLGPVFVIYKIWSVIRQAHALAELLPGKKVVPVFWMASEDHDLNEIDHVRLFGKTHQWDPGEHGGPVGRLDTAGLLDLTKAFEDLAGPGQDFSVLLEPFSRAYKSGRSLAQATRLIINDFFGKDGLVVIDPDDELLKRRLQPVMQADILASGFAMTMNSGAESVQQAGFKVQVNPRKHHFFMLQDGKRLRIDGAPDGFVLEPGGKPVSHAQMEKLIGEKPGIFSPNVLLRPVYQQLILPNIAYVCGPAELAYWHQLYPAFLQSGAPAPLLRLRDSFVWMDSQASRLMDDLKLPEEIYWSAPDTAAAFLHEKLAGESEIKIMIRELTELNNRLKNELYRAKSPVLKELVKQGELYISSLKKEDTRMERDLRTGPLAPIFARLEKLQEKIFNRAEPQERNDFWLELYLKYYWFEAPYSYLSDRKLHIFSSLFQTK